MKHAELIERLRSTDPEAASALASIHAQAEAMAASLKTLDDFWSEDFKPPQEDPRLDDLRILSRDTLAVWRSARQALAATGEPPCS